MGQPIWAWRDGKVRRGTTPTVCHARTELGLARTEQGIQEKINDAPNGRDSNRTPKRPDTVITTSFMAEDARSSRRRGAPEHE